MKRKPMLRRVSFLVLCAMPLLIVPITGARGLRVPVVHEVVGLLLFATLALSAWWLARAPVGSATSSGARDRLAGILLLTPFALIALLWVGLGTPWDATPPENEMRYGVLLAGAIAITSGFFLLGQALRDAGEDLYSILGLSMNVMSGAAFVVWCSFQLGFWGMTAAGGQVPAELASMNNVFDALLFAAGALGYFTTAAFARSLGKLRWLGRGGAHACVSLNVLALALLMLRGVTFPSLGASPEPWYARPGFIVGIPAVPWIMPFLLGILLLRRAGEDRK